jgi:hypothetical protein
LLTSILKANRAAAWLCLLFGPLLLLGQTNPPAPVYPVNRFLFIIETSRSMQRRSDAMRQSVLDTLRSAVANQAHPGDTLGIWTFNEELYTKVFPLQKWSAESPSGVGERVASFLKAQKLEKATRFDKVMPVLDRLTRNSQFITVILISMGDTDIQGTPFDSRINEFFRKWRLQQQDAGSPFVIGLRAQAGKFVDCTMNPSPWPAELPPLPKELLTPITSPPAVATGLKKPATSSVPPLIISGKKREPSTSPPGAAGTPTNSTPVRAAATEPTPQADKMPNVASGTPAPGTPVPAPEPPKQTLAPTENAKSTSGSSPASARSDSAVVTPAADNKQPVSAVPQNPSAPQAASVPSTPPSITRQEDDIAHQSVHAEALAPARQRASNDAPVELGVSVPLRKPVYQALLIFVALVSLGALVAAAAWFWRARSRPAGETSIITESLDRRKK